MENNVIKNKKKSTKKKKLGDFKAKINKYFKENENKILHKQGLNQYLGVTIKDIYNWRHRNTQKQFIIEYDKAIAKIENWLLNGSLTIPQYKWEYWKLAFYKLEPIEQTTNTNNISINVETVRVIENE